ncbi:MAG TPA: hypothetical protein VMJ73_02290 [Rhizomicrobium sp.]|nr:hypothetical protein [Rhizomicrobium sp.]
MRDQFVVAFKQVFGFLVQGIDFEADKRRAFEAELRDLIAPHMPVLIHRRAKLLAEMGDERWSDELQTFMQRSLWPLLGPDREYADRNRTFVMLMLDVAIEREQRRAAEERVAVMPQVSRFDATWAT